MTEESREIIEVIKDLYTKLDNKIDAVASDIKKIEIKLENETNKNIQLLAEGFTYITEKSEKLDAISDDMEVVKFDVDIIKKVVTTHSKELNKLGKVK